MILILIAGIVFAAFAVGLYFVVAGEDRGGEDKNKK